jgi:hypothetical protein
MLAKFPTKDIYCTNGFYVQIFVIENVLVLSRPLNGIFPAPLIWLGTAEERGPHCSHVPGCLSTPPECMDYYEYILGVVRGFLIRQS